MTTWTIGDVSVTKVLEMEAHWPFKALIPEAQDVFEDIDWLRPDFITDEGRMRLSIHALVVESQGKTIIVDTCAGNGKPRPGAPAFADLDTSFLDDLVAAGFDPASVDVVVSTHLHVDHVGWNTRLVDGEWVPTFPNAEYVFVEEEYDYWRDQPQDYGPVFDDSVKPIVDAGLATMVGTRHRITDEVVLEPTVGHTPGHVSVVISSGDEAAVITGDMVHHPVQFVHPDICSHADADQAQAARTRHEAFARWQDGPLVIGTHFAGRTAGRLISVDGAWRLE